MLGMLAQYFNNLVANTDDKFSLTFHSHRNLPVNFNLLIGQQITFNFHKFCSCKILTRIFYEILPP